VEKNFNVEPKIIGVGFQKTGTSSLRETLRSMGYNVGDTNYRVLYSIISGSYKRAKRTLKKFDAVEDNPWAIIYKEIDQSIPNCKFILTIREEEAWYESVSRHIGNLRDPMHEWIYGRGKGLPKDDKENTIKVYKAHNEAVKMYFKDRPEDLLIIHLEAEDKWERIREFLNIDIPEGLFPHINNSKSETNKITIRRRLKVLKKRIKYWFQIKYYRLRGFI